MSRALLHCWESPQPLIYNLARKGEIPATRVGREWRFARTNLIQWVANGAAADQLSVALSRGRVAQKK
jgi:excisionase family DNA binding protein